LRWIGEIQSECVRIEPRAGDGLEHLVAPEGRKDLVPEIKAGAQVCKAPLMLLTAGNSVQADLDRERSSGLVWRILGTPPGASACHTSAPVGLPSVAKCDALVAVILSEPRQIETGLSPSLPTPTPSRFAFPGRR
jgi:hypothetical protein